MARLTGARHRFAPPPASPHLSLSENHAPALLAAAAAPVTALPVPTLAQPALPALDGASEALRAELGALSERVLVLRASVPAALRARAAAQQEALRGDVRACAAAAAGDPPGRSLVVPSGGQQLVSAHAADGSGEAPEAALAAALSELPGARTRVEGAAGRLQRVLAALEAHAAGQGGDALAAAVAAVVAGTACDGLAAENEADGAAETGAAVQPPPQHHGVRQLAARLRQQARHE